MQLLHHMRPEPVEKVALSAQKLHCFTCRAPFDEFWKVMRSAPRIALRQAEAECPECTQRKRARRRVG